MKPVSLVRYFLETLLNKSYCTFFYYNLHVIRNSRSEHSEFGSIRDEKIHRVTRTQSKLANQLRHSQFQHHSLWAQRYWNQANQVRIQIDAISGNSNENVRRWYFVTWNLFSISEDSVQTQRIRKLKLNHSSRYSSQSPIINQRWIFLRYPLQLKVLAIQR